MRIPRPTAEEQKLAIEDIVLSKQVIAGDTWYIIAKKWFQDWENYVGSSVGADGDAPGPIDNSPLVNADNTLIQGMSEYRDFELLAEEAWSLLHQWYAGGPALPRKAVKLPNRSLFVEVRLLIVNFAHKEYGVVSQAFSKADTLGEMKNQICTRWNINPAEVSVWDGTSPDSEPIEVVDTNKQLGDIHITEGQKIFVTSTKMTIGGDTTITTTTAVHSTDSNGGAEDTVNHPMQETSYSYPSSSYSYPSSSYSYPSSSYSYPYTSSSYSSPSYSSSSYSSSSSYYDSPKKASKYPPPPAGIVGLNNLGNTCFMNSSLQCLSNTVPLADFFLADAHVKDINVDNPLGMKGKLAEEFAKLTKELWNGQNSAVAPREFKSKLETFAPQFYGYQQHDSQELLAFLLDGLHEDLNRVKTKLYATATEGDGIPDEVRAKEAWEIHKGRNDSIIVDWFQASLKSTLVCPTCARVSVTFDPFMYLSLPLPMKVDRSIPLTLVTRNHTTPTKYLVKVQKNGTIANLKAKLGEMAGIPPDCIIMTDVFNCKFFKKFSDSESIDSFDEERDVLFAYEVQPQPVDGPKLSYVAVYNRKDEPRNPHYPSLQPNTQLFGTPFFISVPSDLTYRELYTCIEAGVARWLRNDARQIIEERQHNIINNNNNNNSSNNYNHNHQEEEEGSNRQNHNNSNAQQQPSSEDEDGESALQRNVVGEEEEEEEEEQVNSISGPHFFTIQSVDSHGYHETPLYNNDVPLDLENHHTLTIHWKTEFLHLLVDTKISVNHPSVNTVDPDDPDGVTLDKCLVLYTTMEMLGPDDLWYCNRCKEHRQATKKIDLWSTPRILVVHLKRFSYRNKYFREKLETLVSYPLRGLDLSHHIIGPTTPAPIYDLYAVSNHYGSLSGGHYTAFALNKSTNKWYKFDDSYVSEVEESQVISSSAYVLFYRRRDTIDIPAVPTTSTPTTTTSATDSYDDTVPTPSTSSASPRSTSSSPPPLSMGEEIALNDDDNEHNSSNNDNNNNNKNNNSMDTDNVDEITTTTTPPMDLS